MFWIIFTVAATGSTPDSAGPAFAGKARWTGRGSGVLYQLYSLVRGTHHLRVQRRHLRIEDGSVGAQVQPHDQRDHAGGDGAQP
jgi:hypothetical protein